MPSGLLLVPACSHSTSFPEVGPNFVLPCLVYGEAGRDLIVKGTGFVVIFISSILSPVPIHRIPQNWESMERHLPCMYIRQTELIKCELLLDLVAHTGISVYHSPLI